MNAGNNADKISIDTLNEEQKIRYEFTTRFVQPHPANKKFF